MPIMGISIVPIETKTASVSRHIAKAENILKSEKGIKYTLTAMGTIIEADSMDKLSEIAAKMHKSVLTNLIKRVVTTIKIDDRTDKRLTMEGKIRAVHRESREGL